MSLSRDDMYEGTLAGLLDEHVTTARGSEDIESAVKALVLVRVDEALERAARRADEEPDWYVGGPIARSIRAMKHNKETP